MQKKRYEKPFTKYAADTDVVLECLHEVYGLEGKQVLSGKNIHSTMIYPFIKMLENQCRDIPAEKLHKMLWKVYEEHSETADFLEKAGAVLKPHLQEEKDEGQEERPVCRTQMGCLRNSGYV